MELMARNSSSACGTGCGFKSQIKPALFARGAAGLCATATCNHGYHDTTKFQYSYYTPRRLRHERKALRLPKAENAVAQLAAAARQRAQAGAMAAARAQFLRSLVVGGLGQAVGGGGAVLEEVVAVGGRRLEAAVQSGGSSWRGSWSVSGSTGSRRRSKRLKQCP